MQIQRRAMGSRVSDRAQGRHDDGDHPDQPADDRGSVARSLIPSACSTEVLREDAPEAAVDERLHQLRQIDRQNPGPREHDAP